MHRQELEMLWDYLNIEENNMGLFKWSVKLGEYGEYIADGYVFAETKADAYEKVKNYYRDKYHNVIIEDDWNFFFDEDLNKEDYESYKKFNNEVIIRWED